MGILLSISSIFRFPFVSTFPLQLLPTCKTRWPVIPEVPSYESFSTDFLQSFSLLVYLGCPVSCKFPHGTLHYQSHKSPLLVGGSTLFCPDFMYGLISIKFFCSYGFLISYYLISSILIDFPLSFDQILSYLFDSIHFFPFGSKMQIFPISLATTFGLSVDYFPLVLRCFNSQLVITFFRMLLHLWYPTFLLQALMFIRFSARFSFPSSTSNSFMSAYRSV